MNTTIGCALLGMCTVLVWPPALATLLGWEPPLPHRGDGSARLLAMAASTGHAALLAGVTPRLAAAPGTVTTVCSCTAALLAITAAALCVAYERTPAGQHEEEHPPPTRFHDAPE
ncbi:hypothetical protein [Streptomyces sp. NPDC001508]|uniref:hypothetical protein n=1 Tax=Streptomyces sp. NPDC001508 TaxID=3154656 RepID=UPI00332DD084